MRVKSNDTENFTAKKNLNIGQKLKDLSPCVCFLFHNSDRKTLKDIKDDDILSEA